MLDLKPLKVSDRILVLGTPWTGRLVLFGMALFLGCLMASIAAFTPVVAVLALLSFLAAFYTERWQFDPERQLVVHTEGVLFLKKKKSFNFDKFVRVELRNSRPAGGGSSSDFGPGASDPAVEPDEAIDQKSPHKRRGRGFSGLFLVLADGVEVNVHTTSIRRAQEQDKLGRMISKVCRKPFSTYA
jgi:hypothetical protein